MSERTPRQAPATPIPAHDNDANTLPTRSAVTQDLPVPPSPLLNARAGTTAAPGHMTAAELSDAFVVRRVEAREEHELLRQANQAPTNADIELLFAQTDRRFEVLQQQAMAYSMRVESDLAVLMDSMGRELRQLEREVARLTRISREQEIRGPVSPYERSPYPGDPSYTQHQQAQHQQAQHLASRVRHQAGALSPGGGGAGHHQFPAGGYHGQQVQGRPTVRTARSYPTLSSFLPSLRQ